MGLPEKIPFDDTEWIHAPRPGQSLVFFDNDPERRMQVDFTALSNLGGGPQSLIECGFSTLQLRQMLAFADEVTAVVSAALGIAEKNQ